MLVVCEQGQNVELHGLEQAQRALLSNIETSLTAVQSAQTDLEQKSHLPPLGSDPVSTVTCPFVTSYCPVNSELGTNPISTATCPFGHILSSSHFPLSIRSLLVYLVYFVIVPIIVHLATFSILSLSIVHFITPCSFSHSIPI